MIQHGGDDAASQTQTHTCAYSKKERGGGQMSVRNDHAAAGDADDQYGS